MLDYICVWYFVSGVSGVVFQVTGYELWDSRYAF
jgi:hypothetical protein